MVEDYELKSLEEDIRDLKKENEDLKYDLNRLQKNFDELEQDLINANVIKRSEY